MYSTQPELIDVVASVFVALIGLAFAVSFGWYLSRLFTDVHRLAEKLAPKEDERRKATKRKSIINMMGREDEYLTFRDEGLTGETKNTRAHENRASSAG
jgi:hypothetical protein